MRKILLFSCVAALVLVAQSFAEELLIPQAIDYYNEGVRAQRGGDYDRADAAYQKTLLLDNSDNWRKYIINNYGVIYAQQNDINSAEAAFKEALRMDPSFKPALFNLGLIYDRREDRLRAMEFWLKALGIDLDKLKPKGFVIEEKAIPAPKKQ